jgi:hypothetical protein
MKMKELTPKQLSSVPCPTCGVAAGKHCVLHSGAPRTKPHVDDRKLRAADVIETKRISRGPGLWRAEHELIARLSIDAPPLKDESLREEHEWRIVSKPLNCESQGFGFREGKTTTSGEPHLSLPATAWA